MSNANGSLKFYLYAWLLVLAGSNLGQAETNATAPSRITGDSSLSEAQVTSPQNASGSRLPLDLEQPESIVAYCQNLSHGKDQAAALQSVCEFSLSLRQKLPDVICDQETKRYREGAMGDVLERDTITAKVRYEGGHEQYSQIAIDGRPVTSSVVESSGAWSEGEFATGLRTIFLPQALTDFKFTKQEKLRSREVLVFDFKVDRKNNRSWYLRASSGGMSFPGYRGRIWIDQSTLKIVRFERKLSDVENDFPIQQVNTVIDYADVDLADGSSFVLPVQAVNVTCPTETSKDCWHNQLNFKHWQKFATRTRILASEGESSPSAPSAKTTVTPEIVSLPRMDVRQDPGIEAEVLSSELVEVIQQRRIGELVAYLRFGQGKILPKLAPSTEARPANSSISNQATPGQGEITTFKASARLVLVPTVVRDSQGRPVDHLKRPDFRLLDDHKPQAITQFSVERPGGDLAASEGSAAEVSSRETNGVPRHYAAYLFDDIHAAMDDLIRARDAAKRHLISLRSDDRAAIFTLSGNLALDFTNDHAQLNGALMRIRPHPLTATGSVRCPDISYAQAELIRSNDSNALDQATQQAMQCAFAGDSTAKIPAERLARDTASEVLLAGRAESQRSFGALREVVQRISAMSGQRIIVLVSPGFPIAEMEQESSEIIEAAQNAEVMINVLDPSGLSTHSSVDMGSTSAPTDVLADLTSGTGGSFFHNRNSVDEGFMRTSLPELFYVLGFAPQKLDGKYHSLKVILERPDKLNLQARRGYYALKPD